MSEVILINNEFITLRYLPGKRMLYHTIHKPISGQPLREALLTGYDAMKHYGISKWLSDDRKNGPMSDEDREWGRVNINQRSMEAGWKYWALVAPEAVVAAGSMAPTMEMMQGYGLQMMVFSNLDEAFAWLDRFED